MALRVEDECSRYSALTMQGSLPWRSRGDCRPVVLLCARFRTRRPTRPHDLPAMCAWRIPGEIWCTAPHCREHLPFHRQAGGIVAGRHGAKCRGSFRAVELGSDGSSQFGGPSFCRRAAPQDADRGRVHLLKSDSRKSKTQPFGAINGHVTRQCALRITPR